MNDPMLVEKHLSDGLTDEEAAGLESMVSRDPETARRLVAAARLDQRLAARLGAGGSEAAILAGLKRGRITAGRTTDWRRRLMLAVAAMVVVGGLATTVGAWMHSIRRAPTHSGAVTQSGKSRPLVPARIPVATDRADDLPRLEVESPAMATLRRFLSSYYLTDLKLEAARPLDEALGQLLQRARELNHLRNPAIERLRAELVAAEDGQDSSSPVVALPFKHSSLMDGLNWVAALNRSEVFLKEPGVITFRPWEPEDDEALATEVVRVRPDLLTHPASTGGENPTAAEPGSSSGGTDPLVGSPEPQASQRLTPIELFQSWGIAFGGRASAAYDDATASMTIRHHGSTLRVIKALLGIDGHRPTTMVLVSTKVFEFTQARPIKDELLTDEPFQHWLRETNQTQGVNLIGAPQITTRGGQRGMIEIGREMAPEGDWQGLRMPIETVLEGEVVKVMGTVELRHPVDRQPATLLGPQAPSTSELMTTATDFEVIVPPGQTAVFSLNESPEGSHLAMTLTVVTIDPSGQRVGTPTEILGSEETDKGKEDAR